MLHTVFCFTEAKLQFSLVIFQFNDENMGLMMVAECGQMLCKLPLRAQLRFLSRPILVSALHNLGSPEGKLQIVPNCRQYNGKVGKY